MPPELEITLNSLRAVMRATPPLSGEDSIGRFVRLCRQFSCRSLPVVSGGRLCGMVSEADILPLLRQEDAGDVEAALQRPLSDVMHPPEISVQPGMSPHAVRMLFTRYNLDLMSALPVVDADGYCLGIVVYNDLLAAEGPTCRPGTVGGMATPFGVYLTDGTVQAGAGNLALVASGMVTGVLLLIAGAGVNAGLEWLARAGALPAVVENLDVGDVSAHATPLIGLLGLGVKLLIYLVFFGLLRATSIAGYHAAEHQTVHAMERNEPLVADIVRRMPRPHPRCGTNLMAIGLLQFTLYPLLVSLLRLDIEDAFVLAAVATMLLWRKSGTFLQAVFTTRPATEKQLASGIAAGRALLGTFYTTAPARPHWARRIWCTGMLQNLAGLLLVTGPAQTALWAFTRFAHR